MYRTTAAPTPPLMLDPSAYTWMEAVFTLSYVMAVSSFWEMSVSKVGVQDGWRWEGWMVSISPDLRL